MKNEFEIRGDYAAIFLEAQNSERREVLIDVDDLPLVDRFAGHWRLLRPRSATKAYVYAVAYHRDHETGKRRATLMHRVVAGAERGTHVDHMNHNTLDNRRSNLRVVSPALNVLYQQREYGLPASGVRGVARVPSGRFVARIRHQGRGIHLGTFDSIQEARDAYEIAFSRIAASEPCRYLQPRQEERSAA